MKLTCSFYFHLYTEEKSYCKFGGEWRGLVVSIADCHSKVVFKLKTAISVDELIGSQNFEFTRKSTRQGKSHSDIIGCKIKEIGQQNQKENSNAQYHYNPMQDDGTRLIYLYTETNT